MLSFDPKKKSGDSDVVVPKDAATVIALREAGGRAVETFAVVRHRSSAFMGGALVFPGGKLEASDADVAWEECSTAPREGVESRAVAIAAARETFEEARILPLTKPVDAALLEEIAAHASRSSLREALASRGLVVALDMLVPFSRWITPIAESRRFDARFFLLRAPEGQLGKHDGRETTQGFWATPADLLDRGAKGEIFLAPPTSRTLEILAEVKTVEEAMELAASQTIEPIMPEFVAADPPFLALPGDPAHSIRERRVAGHTRFVFREGRFASEAAPKDSAKGEG